MFVTWLVSHPEMWPYVDSAELRLESQELTAEWILLLDIAVKPAARSAATSSATAARVPQAKRRAAAMVPSSGVTVLLDAAVHSWAALPATMQERHDDVQGLPQNLKQSTGAILNS